MQNLPVYISISFIITTLLTLFLFARAVTDKKVTFLILITWMLLQMVLGYFGFYLDVQAKPFKFLLAAPPALLVILFVFLNKKGRNWLNTLDLKALTLVHLVRIPVELILYGLFIYNMIPELMTFSGRNFDILAGISAPFVYYFGFVKKQMGRIGILVWNVVCLILLLNIVINAILSVQLPIQQFAFDQPNIAILHFPFVWLPTVVVPIVLFAHIVTIYRLLRPKKV